MATVKTFTNDCLEVLPNLKRGSVDLIYVDPPFFTQKVHQLTTRDGGQRFSFADIWDNDSSYADFIYQRVNLMRELLKDSGSIFFHCDKTASHIIRLLLDSVFGSENFRSEIIWHFRRWSNSKKGLLPAHQTLLFYSKSDKFKFYPIFTDYSPSTNVDQIMQKRTRDNRNKSVYARNEVGEIISSGSKKGVPLSDVWEIPFLNPKAKERVGYPTQKPILLMNRILELTTEKDDTVLDPFCGSGTTLVAAQILERNSIGIDVSEDAISLTKSRLANPVVSSSSLLQNGRASYQNHDKFAEKILSEFDYTPVQRNKGIDGLLENECLGVPMFVRVQRPGETLSFAIEALSKAASKKGECHLIVVQTQSDLLNSNEKYCGVSVIQSASVAFANYIATQKYKNVRLGTKLVSFEVKRRRAD